VFSVNNISETETERSGRARLGKKMIPNSGN